MAAEDRKIFFDKTFFKYVYYTENIAPYGYYS